MLIVLAKLIYNLITLALSSQSPLGLILPSRSHVISGEGGTRGPQRPAEHSLIPSAPCMQRPHGETV